MDQTARQEAQQLEYNQNAVVSLIEKISHIGSWRWDIANNTLFWSPELFAILEKDPAVFTPTLDSFSEVVQLSDGVVLKDILEKAKTEKQSYTSNARLYEKDSVSLSFQCFSDTGDDGSVSFVSGIIQDLTQKEKDQLEKQESDQRFRQIAEYISQVFWMTDPTKNSMLYISPGYEKIWGRTTQSLLSNPKDWIDAILEEDRARVLDAAINKQIQGTYDEEYRITRPDGSIRWIHDRAFPIKDDQGKVYRVVGVAEDISERRKVIEALREKTEELEQLNKSFIGREIKMVELKEELKVLKEKLTPQ